MIPLFKPYMPELPDIQQILMSGKLAAGEYTVAFEESLRKYFDEKYVLVTNTFSNAICVATTTLGLSYGDEILASPMGCLVSTQPYLTSGLRIKWCDIDVERGTLSPESVRQSITSKTKAIVHNHFCGYPGYIDEINEIGREYGIPVIDDGIECFGSQYKGRKVGHCGTDVTVFALSAVRIPNTIDGGVIIFKKEEHYKKALRIRDCGIDRLSFRDYLGEINPKCDISEIGYSATMSNVHGYIGLKQMEIVDKLLAKQKEIAVKWDAYFQKQSSFVPICCDDISPNYWVYGVRTKEKNIQIARFRDLGYYASGVHIDNGNYSVFGDRVELPGVQTFNAQFMALPCGWWMEDVL